MNWTGSNTAEYIGITGDVTVVAWETSINSTSKWFDLWQCIIANFPNGAKFSKWSNEAKNFCKYLQWANFPFFQKSIGSATPRECVKSNKWLNYKLVLAEAKGSFLSVDYSVYWSYSVLAFLASLGE